MDINRRQSEIIELFKKEAKLGIKELALRYNVSEMTIRRDLDLLEKQNIVFRTHGGAAANNLRFVQNVYSEHLPSPQKQAIGKYAANMVQKGQTVMVDSGTTALEVARNLPQDLDITVVTTSLCVAQELYGSPIKVLLIGGFLRGDFPSSYGPMTESMLSNLRVDILFIGCDGADSTDGFYTIDLLISNLEQMMLKITDRVVVVTESSKFGRRAFVRYAAPSQVHTLITDSDLSQTDQKNLEESGIDIIIV